MMMGPPTPGLLVALLSLGGLLQPSSSAPARVAAAVAPAQAIAAEKWATTYLLNTLFILEYTFLKHHKEAEQSAPIADFSAVVARAAFAHKVSIVYGQKIPQHSSLMLKLADDERAAGLSLPKIQGKDAVRLAAGKMAATFPQASEQAWWAALAANYDEPSIPYPCLPEAAEPADDLRAFCFALRGLEASLGLREGAPTQRGLESPPLKILPRAFPSLTLLATVDHLMTGNFPAALDLLLTLQESTPALRLAYEKVQRLYSVKEKGSGRVAIQGL